MDWTARVEAANRKKSLRASPVKAERLTYEGGSSPTKNRLILAPPVQQPVHECEGNRIVSMRMLHEGLREHLRCPQCKCHGTLTLSREREVSKGFAGDLRWWCARCKEPTLCVETSPRAARQAKSGPAPTDLNMRAALAAVHSGIGQQQMARLFGIMDMPVPAHTTWALAEKRVHDALLVVGERSMARQLDLERSLSWREMNDSLEVCHRLHPRRARRRELAALPRAVGGAVRRRADVGAAVPRGGHGGVRGLARGDGRGRR